MKSKIIQIQAVQNDNMTKLFALCEDGSLWFNNQCSNEWFEIKGTYQEQEYVTTDSGKEYKRIGKWS